MKHLRTSDRLSNLLDQSIKEDVNLRNYFKHHSASKTTTAGQTVMYAWCCRMNKFCMRGSLYYPPIQRPRPLSDITEVDPDKVPLNKTVHWALYRGFYDEHKVDYGTTFTEQENGYYD